jgi:hypothetical protein
MRLTTTFSLIAVSLVLSAAGCAPSASTSQAENSDLRYTPSQLRSSDAARAGARQAIGLLESTGWCEIPSSALPRGWSHSDLVRQMACIANKESTFGRNTTGPGDTGYGVPYGYWQVVTGHMGQRVTVHGKTYRCPASSVSQLRNDPKISAACSLYVYMESVQKGVSGLRPWEAKCSATERNMLANDGTPVFRPACQNLACKDKTEIAVDATTGVVAVRIDPTCKAAKARFVFLKADNPKLNAGSAQDTQHDKDVAFDPQTRAAFVHSAAALIDGFNAVRVIVLDAQGNELYRTNPSPKLPATLALNKTPLDESALSLAKD